MAYIRKTADIFISPTLQHVLRRMSSNSVIARDLAKGRCRIDSLVEDYVNYISISEDDPTKISYLTKARIEKFATGEWQGQDVWTSLSKRFCIKPGGFVKKIFKNYPETEIEKFATIFRNIQSGKKHLFKVVKGEDIKTWYNHESYASHGSSLGASCMRYGYCMRLMNMYTENPDVISMVILTDANEKLLGRALLWHFDDHKIMDRIYTVNDEDYSWHFKKWADENGYMYKKEQKWNNSLFFESNGQTQLLELGVKLDNHRFEEYPYLDTFKFYEKSTGTFYNYIPKDKSVRTLVSTNGGSENGEYLGQDYKSKLFYYHGELVPIKNISMQVIGKSLHANAVYSKTFGTHILKDHAVYNHVINDYVFKIQANIQDIPEHLRPIFEKYTTVAPPTQTSEQAHTPHIPTSLEEEHVRMSTITVEQVECMLAGYVPVRVDGGDGLIWV